MKRTFKSFSFLLIAAVGSSIGSIDSRFHLIPSWIEPVQGENRLDLNVFGYDQAVIDSWMKRAKKRKGWIVRSGRVSEVEVTSVTLRDPAENRFPRRVLSVTYVSNDPVEQAGHFAVFSLDALPKQTWQPGQKESIKTIHGEFRLKLRPSTEESAFVEYKIDVQRLVGGKWESVQHFTDQGASWTADYDGDGVPEIVCSTGYKDVAIRRVYPDLKDLVVNRSGV